MDKENLYKKGGQKVFRVDRIFNIKATQEYLHPHYNLLISDSNDMTETGLIILFTLKPKESTMPSFAGRWDQNKQVLDIDILGVTKEIENLFKLEKEDYSGHHPRVASASPRLFTVDIKIPNTKIFRGDITFNINHGHDPALFRHFF